MTLISIIIGLALEYFLGPLDRLRKLSWFDRYSNWLERQCSHLSFWDGAAGVVITLGLPLLAAILCGHFLNELSPIFGFVFATFVFIYSLGPELNSALYNYLDALEADDEANIQDTEQELLRGRASGENTEEERLIQAILVRAHEGLFGIIFWFIVLGFTGALFYCLTVRVHRKYVDIHGGYAAAAKQLHNILIWPSARLMALGFALSGSLVDALEGWRNGSDEDRSSEKFIGQTGLGALQYVPYEADNEFDDERAQRIDWIQQTQALINRTLIVWMTALAILTIGNWLS